MIVEKASIPEARLGGGPMKGPRTDRTKVAQAAVDEFLSMGIDSGKVDWSGFADDFRSAKQAVAYRIRWSKENGLDGAGDLAMRSDPRTGEVFLVHLDRI